MTGDPETDRLRVILQTIAEQLSGENGEEPGDRASGDDERWREQKGPAPSRGRVVSRLCLRWGRRCRERWRGRSGDPAPGGGFRGCARRWRTLPARRTA